MNHSNEKLAKILNSESYKAKNERFKRMINLGEKIYGRRKDLGLTQKELAQKSGLNSQRAISQLEHGEYAENNGLSEDVYNRLAEALEIDRDYLFSEKINRQTFELYAYLSEKMNYKLDIMQFMKLPYFIDLKFVKSKGFQLSNFTYERNQFGPFDKKVYTYKSLFEDKKYTIEYSFLKEFIVLVEEALKDLPITNGERLKKMSYDTTPMKKLGATLGGKECFNELLDLTA